MSRKWIVVAAVALCVPAAWWLAQRMGSRIVTVTPPDRRDFSDARVRTGGQHQRSAIHAVALSIPPSKDEPVRGTLSVRLRLAERTPVIFDFAQPAEHVSSIQANGQAVPIRSEHGHLIIPGGIADARREHRRHRLHRRRRGAESQRRVSLLAVRAGAGLSGVSVLRPARHQRHRCR